MIIDANKKYFMMSFRFNKTRPEDFDLHPSQQKQDIFVDLKDNSQWIKLDLYNFGWGNEVGFMRLPKLNFEQLWGLLLNSSIEENKYGSAFLIESEYPDELLNFLIELFNNTSQISKSMKEAFKILKLDEVRNRSGVLGKSYNEIQNDFNKWKVISERIAKIQ